MNRIPSIFKTLKSSGGILRSLSRNALLRDLSKKALSTVVVILTAIIVGGGALWAIAAFTEPSVSPASSVQDFAKNIMGADNADNAFSSTSVVANQDGSLIERVEYLQTRPVYLGRTSTAYTGNLGGIAGANTKCQVNYPGSHMCRQSEMLASGATSFGGSGSTWGWVSCESVQQGFYYNSSMATTYLDTICNGVTDFFTGDWSVSSSVVSCGDWTITGGSYNGPIVSGTGDFQGNSCSGSFGINCCK